MGNTRHPTRNHSLIWNFHIIGTISKVFHIRGIGLLIGHQVLKKMKNENR